MINGLLGKKVGMIQVFDDAKRLLPVTVIQAGPGGVVQIKEQARDGYDAVQVGFVEVQERKLNKPELGHLKKGGARHWKHLVEFRSSEKLKPGDLFTVDMFSSGDIVNIQGTSKGKGFQGLLSGIITLGVQRLMAPCFIELLDRLVKVHFLLVCSRIKHCQVKWVTSVLR